MENRYAVINFVRKYFSSADKTIDELWQMMMNRTSENCSDMDRNMQVDFLHDALAETLKEIRYTLPIALEIIGLPESRKAYIDNMKTIPDADLSKLDEYHNDNGDFLESQALDISRCTLNTVESIYSDTRDKGELVQIDILENILECTPRIVNARGIAPTKEQDIKERMHSHLENTFSGFVPNPKISKPIVGFIPDCGIGEIRTAIEFKFVCTMEEYSRAIHGLHEDVSGYWGSRDWTRIYTVIYQTQAFGTKRQVEKAVLQSPHSKRWKVMIVNGPGARPRRMKPAV